jgi:hypothetical protein
LQVDDVIISNNKFATSPKKMRKGVMVMAPQHNIKDSSDKGVNIFTSKLLDDQDVKMCHLGKIECPPCNISIGTKLGLRFTSMNQCDWGTPFGPSH